MAGKPQERPMSAESEQIGNELGEPLFVEDMTLHDNNGSISVTIPATAAKIHGFSAGDGCGVAVYDDGVWIPKGASDE